jgi:phosphatidate cytidylyltransferase
MKRVLTAVLLVPPVTYVVFYGHPFLFLFLTAGIALFCFLEFAQLAKSHGLRINYLAGLAAGMLLMLMPTYDPVLLILPLLAALAWSMRDSDLSRLLPRSGALALGVVYCFGPWRCAIGLRALAPFWLFYALALNWVGDVAAYFIGRRFGKRKLAPSISPGKTWEGAGASLAASILFGLIFLHHFAPDKHFEEVLILTVAANIAGQLGDLVESAIKRGAGVKDSGTMLPGHGGWLDRLDASLFTIPVVYLWLSRLSVLL